MTVKRISPSFDFHPKKIYTTSMKIKNKKAFTLIELLLVIGIIAVLAVVVFVALDPAKRFADARNARRISDTQAILSAIQQYIIDNKGALPAGIDAYERQLGEASDSCEIAGGCTVSAVECIDLTGDLSRYLKSSPYDPQNGSDARTHYSVQVNSSNIVTIRACDAEGGEISASR